ncbi:MAG: divalent-cation tolerance protein CutA [Haliangiales bacterium]
MQVTTNSRAEAEDIAARALAERLVASAQLGAVTSDYRWQGSVHRADETLITMYTRSAAFAALAALIEAHHSYQVAQIIALPLADANPAFLDWIDDNTDLPETK